MRYLLLLFGPIEWIVAILWLTGEETKQTFRDKHVGTYVVKENANPIGNGR